MGYGWAEYKELMERKLAESMRAEHADAPFPLDEKEAKTWHYARQSAFQYVLEMMPPQSADILAMRKALDLALAFLARHEPGDSRAVSDEFVAMAAIACGFGNDDCVAIIDAARSSERITSATQVEEAS